LAKKFVPSILKLMNNDTMQWYDALTKPSWTPSSSVIGTIWTLLYPIIIGVNIYVWILYTRKEISFAVLLPFIINVVANIAFTPIQFGLRSLVGAAACILIVWATIIWSMVAIWPHNRIVAFLFIPYLLWVSLASVLQLSITTSN
jgi:tryptophan-rich sensory protein